MRGKLEESEIAMNRRLRDEMLARHAELDRRHGAAPRYPPVPSCPLGNHKFRFDMYIKYFWRRQSWTSRRSGWREQDAQYHGWMNTLDGRE